MFQVRPSSLGPTAATDVTGFGLGGIFGNGQSLPVLRVQLWTEAVPLMTGGSTSRPWAWFRLEVLPTSDSAIIAQAAAGLTPFFDLMFDAQTSGGMILAIDSGRVAQLKAWLEERGEMAAVVGEVLPERADGFSLVLC